MTIRTNSEIRPAPIWTSAITWAVRLRSPIQRTRAALAVLSRPSIVFSSWATVHPSSTSAGAKDQGSSTLPCSNQSATSSCATDLASGSKSECGVGKTTRPTRVVPDPASSTAASPSFSYTSASEVALRPTAAAGLFNSCISWAAIRPRAAIRSSCLRVSSIPRSRAVTVRNMRRTTLESEISSSKADAGIFMSSVGDVATTLAVRDAPSRSAISPTTSPGPNVARTTSRLEVFLVTSSCPLTMTYISSE